MTDAYLMDADCIHGIPWHECEDCEMQENSRWAFFSKEHPRSINFTGTLVDIRDFDGAYVIALHRPRKFTHEHMISTITTSPEYLIPLC